MTALYVILGIMLFTALVLALRASLVISFSRDILHMYLRVGPVKIQISPPKQKKINFKKSAKTMQGKKLSKLYDVKKKTQAEKKNGKKSAASKLKKLVVEEGNGSDSKQMIEFIFNFLKITALEFDKKMHISIARLHIGVDMGNAHSTAVTCCVLSQSAAYLFELLDRHSVLKFKKYDSVKIFPLINNGVFDCDIFVKIYLSIGSILKSAVSIIISAFKSINSKKTDKNKKPGLRKEL